jgi:YcaO-like protein with predicted kinase domain
MMSLSTRTPKSDLGGTFRAIGPDSTLSFLEGLRAKVGITRVAHVTGLDNIGVPTSVCIRPNAKHLSTSQGKGTTQVLADISAIMESIEGFHAENVRKAEVIGSYSNLRTTHSVLDPKSLPQGMRWGAYSDDKEIGWIWSYDLIESEQVLIPRAFLTMDSSNPDPDWAMFEATTNGLASGNTLSEAICHGLLEVIERESEYRWIHACDDKRITRIDLDTIDAPFLRQILRLLESASVRPLVWNLTSVASVPAFRCVIVDQSGTRCLARFHGSGAHLDKSVALSRAITEAAQARLTWIQGTREDVFPFFYAEQKAISNYKLDFGSGCVDFRRLQTSCAGSTFEEDAMWLSKELQSCGYSRVLVVDHTKEGLAVPVVQVIVPGMRFSGNRF